VTLSLEVSPSPGQFDKLRTRTLRAMRDPGTSPAVDSVLSSPSSFPSLSKTFVGE
jgi:hypothetical protein